MEKDKIDFELISKLPSLLTANELIYIDVVPAQVREDLLTFLIGRTIGSRNGRKFIYKSDYKDWLHKIYNHGFSFSLQTF